MLVLPAIDLLGGKVVRLRQGDYQESTLYSDDPGATAARFAEEGAHWVHVVDLDGAKAGKPTNTDAVRAIVAASSAPVQVGGGVRTRDDAAAWLDLGVSRVIVGSALVQNESLAEQLFAEFGERIVAGVDCRDGIVRVSGWTQSGGLSALEALRRVESAGAVRAVVTDIATDGMLSGPNLDLYREILLMTNLALIASGGVASVDDLHALASLGPRPVEGAITGKAVYEGRFSVREAVESLTNGAS